VAKIGGKLFGKVNFPLFFAKHSRKNFVFSSQTFRENENWISRKMEAKIFAPTLREDKVRAKNVLVYFF
jgi:hypothetical protein